MKNSGFYVFLALSLTFTVSKFGYGQHGFTELTKIKTTAHAVTIDPLGNLYLYSDTELKKYDPEGRLQNTYSNFLAGNISFVDPTDPFKVLVYYQDFSQVEVLDNQLSLSADPLLLQSYGLELATLICRSYNNGIWVYDQQNFELVRLDPRLEKAETSGNISQILGKGINPIFLTEKDNNVYLIDPGSGIMNFDKYGTYIRTFPFHNPKSIQISSNRIYYYTEKQLVTYDVDKISESILKIEGNNIIDVKLSVDLKPERLYILEQGNLRILVKNQ